MWEPLRRTGARMCSPAGRPARFRLTCRSEGQGLGGDEPAPGQHGARMRTSRLCGGGKEQGSAPCPKAPALPLATLAARSLCPVTWSQWGTRQTATEAPLPASV